MNDLTPEELRKKLKRTEVPNDRKLIELMEKIREGKFDPNRN